jgi:hypothetical protein
MHFYFSNYPVHFDIQPSLKSKVTTYLIISVLMLIIAIYFALILFSNILFKNDFLPNCNPANPNVVV